MLAPQTLATTEDFPTRVNASAEAGFSAIGLRPGDYRRARRAGATDADLRAVLEHAGVELVELSVVHGFSADERDERSEEDERTLLHMADVLGGDYLMAVGELSGSIDRTADRFAALCDRAAAHDLRVALEFLPWTSVPDAATAWEIVRRAERANGGVLVDSWHHFRGARDDEQLLAIPPERVFAVQLDDADAEPVGTLLEDTLHRRRMPGEGAFPLGSFIRLLEEHGVTAPLSVEVLSDEVHALPAAEAARRAMECTRRVLGEVDAS